MSQITSDMTTEEFYNKFRASFIGRLQRKTGWGRNEIITEFDLALYEIAINMVSELFERKQKE